MTEVDMDKINKERNDKLQSILNSNIEARKQEFNQAEGTCISQSERVEKIHAHLVQVSEQVKVLT